MGSSLGGGDLVTNCVTGAGFPEEIIWRMWGMEPWGHLKKNVPGRGSSSNKCVEAEASLASVTGGKWVPGTVRGGANEVRQVKMEPRYMWTWKAMTNTLWVCFALFARRRIGLHQMALTWRGTWPDCHSSCHSNRVPLVPGLVLKL